jgi:hypothetical protein
MKGTNLVAQAKLGLGKLHAATNALGDREALVVELSRELERDAVQVRACARVDAHRRHDLSHDRPEVPSLVTRGRRHRAERL